MRESFCREERTRGHSRSPVDSIRDAVFTVSPKRQYRGMVRPTTPATQGPETQVCPVSSSRSYPREAPTTFLPFITTPLPSPSYILGSRWRVRMKLFGDPNKTQKGNDICARL